MAKDKAAKKKSSKKKASVYDPVEVSAESETDPVVIIPDMPPARNIVAVGQRFWLLSKGHRRKARPVQVAGVFGEGDSVTIRCMDNGEKRILPRIAFATAGSSRVLRA